MLISYDAAMLAVRLIVGLAIAAHGSQKLFGWFGGYGLKGTGGFFEGLGFRPGTLFAFAAGLGEFAGGVLIALGFLGPVGAALVASTMLVAIVAVHWSNGFFQSNNGYELALMYATAAMTIAFAGPGSFSLDYALRLGVLDTPYAAWIGLVAAIAIAGVNLAIRRPAAQPVATPATSGLVLD